MKKISIFISLTILLLALLPLIGNSLVQTILETKIEALKSKGVEVTQLSSDSSYISTFNHYEIKSNNLAENTLFGVDIEYSNIPFSKDILIDVYPISLSNSVMNELKSRDKEFSLYLANLLKSRALLFHYNYNLISKDFSGYIKDINEKQSLKNGQEIIFTLTNAHYYGRGDIASPELFSANISSLYISSVDKDEKLYFKMSDFINNSKFESASSYKADIQASAFELKIESLNETLNLDADTIKLTQLSSTKESKAYLYSKFSSQDLKIKLENILFNTKDFKSEIALEELDKDSLELFRVSSKNDIQSSLIELLSKGIILNIKEFSTKKIILNNTQDLDGFNIQSTLRLKEDSAFATKINYMPLLLAQSIDTDLRVKVSNKIFLKMIEIYPMLTLIKSYSKDEGSSLLYDVSYKNGNLKVNGKKVY